MDVDGYLPLVLPVIAALAAHPLAERLPPRTATWVLTALAAGLAGCATVTLAALAQGAPVAAVALAAAITSATYATIRHVRALRSMARAARELPGDPTLAVIDDDHVDAYTVPGRVVVSTGMLALLTPAER